MSKTFLYASHEGFGTIAADFVLTKENSLTDIHRASDMHGVFTQGHWHSAAALANMLAETKALFASP